MLVPFLHHGPSAMTTAPRIAFSYVRFSSKAQELNDSLRRQTEASKRYARENNLNLSEQSFEDLGVSAFKGNNSDIEKNGGLALFLRAVDEGVIPPDSILLVESLDRISRQSIDSALELFMSIIRRGITIVSLIDNQTFSKERIAQDHGISLIISITTFLRAHDESLVKSKRVKAAWTQKRVDRKILTKVCPGWLKVADDYSHYLILEDRVEIVQKVFELALQGLGAVLIAKKLNEEGIRLLTKDEPWKPENVAALLKNQAVFGKYVPAKAKNVLPVEDQYPVIVSKEEFDRVAEMTSTRASGRRTVDSEVGNLFSNLSFCSACGGRFRFVSQSKTKSGSSLKYFRCATSYSSKTDCSAERFPYHILEEQLLELIFSREPVAGGYKHGPIVDYRRRVEEKETQLNNLLELVMAGMRTPLIDDKIRTLTEGIEADKKLLVSSPIASPVEQVYARSHRYYSKLMAFKAQDKRELAEEMRVKLRVEIPRLVSRLEVSRINFTDGESIFRRCWVDGPIFDAIQTVDIKLVAHGINGTRTKSSIEQGKIKFLDELPELQR